MPHLRRHRPTLAALCLALLVSGRVLAAEDESAELAKKLQNPVADLINVPFQSNFEWGGGSTNAPDWGMRFSVFLLFPRHADALSA